MDYSKAGAARSDFGARTWDMLNCLPRSASAPNSFILAFSCRLVIHAPISAMLEAPVITGIAIAYQEDRGRSLSQTSTQPINRLDLQAHSHAHPDENTVEGGSLLSPNVARPLARAQSEPVGLYQRSTSRGLAGARASQYMPSARTHAIYSSATPAPACCWKLTKNTSQSTSVDLAFPAAARAVGRRRVGVPSQSRLSCGPDAPV